MTMERYEPKPSVKGIAGRMRKRAARKFKALTGTEKELSAHTYEEVCLVRTY